MKGKTKVKLIILLIVCLAAALIAGCGEMTKDDYLNKNDAAGQSVTYFANGGKFNDKDRDVMELYFKADSPILVDVETNNFKISRTNYTFDAWYYTAVDDEGNLVLDKNGEPVYGQKVGANDLVGAGKHLYVIAGWSANVAIDVVLVTDGFTVTDAEDNVYESGDVINTLNFGTTSTYGLSERSTGLEAKDATYLYFYEDKECTRPIASVAKPTEGEENVKVYAKYLQGKWTVVKTASEVRNMFYSNSGSFYLFTPDGTGVIDCSTAGMTLNGSDFGLVIEGNGVVLDNVKFEDRGLSSGEYSALGKLKAYSVVRNLTFKNVSITATVQSGLVEIYLFCHDAEQGAVLENVTVDTVTVNISKPNSDDILVTNINRDGGAYSTDNWLFGGFETDDDFLAWFDGVEVKNASLIFRNNTLVENISK